MPTTRRRRADVLAFDVGNTSVKCALIGGTRCERLFRVPTLPAETLAKRLWEAAAGRQIRAARCVVCSVHPPAEGAVVEFWQGIGGRRPPLFFGRQVSVPIPLRIVNPASVGQDRLLMALAARRLCGAPCIAVSTGTAITVDLVDAEGAFAGGAIAPGFGLALAALHHGTACLPMATPARPAKAVGTDTHAAIQSGVYWFCAGGVLALLAQYGKELGGTPPVVCTGTDAPLLLPALAEYAPMHEPDLIFKGMAEALAQAR